MPRKHKAGDIVHGYRITHVFHPGMMALAYEAEAPDGTHAYTTMNDHDSVAVIDLKTFTITGEVKTGRGPDGLAWAARR